jgi:hypothetical protein
LRSLRPAEWATVLPTLFEHKLTKLQNTCIETALRWAGEFTPR